MIALLPLNDELYGWRPSDEPQVVEGDDLYMLIDGGADIYHEYGFKRVVIQSYTSEEQRTINVEIYEMINPESSYGIYSFKVGNKGKKVEIGNDGFLESYYLNFWRGRYLATLIGFDTSEETVEGIIGIARAIDSKIGGQDSKPSLVHYLPTKDLRENGFRYLKGNLALFNSYSFDPADLFGLREGVIGAYDTHTIFLFLYPDSFQSESWFDHAVAILRHSSRFVPIKVDTRPVVLTDRNGKSIVMEPYQNTILIVSGVDNNRMKEAIQIVKEKIDTEFSGGK